MENELKPCSFCGADNATDENMRHAIYGAISGMRLIKDAADQGCNFNTRLGANAPTIAYVVNVVLDHLKYIDDTYGLVREHLNQNCFQPRPNDGHARTMLKVEIAPGIEVFMTANQKTAWEALKK